MELEILFWGAMMALVVFLIARAIRAMRTRSFQDDALAEVFERHRGSEDSYKDRAA